MSYWDTLTSHQKLSLGIFVVVGSAGLLLLPFLLMREISLPFQRTGAVTFKTAEEAEREAADALRRRDDDGDGLNNYDEQFVFRTSPYIADSDSDGIDDGTEVAQDSDPNCPKGKTCRQASLSANGAGPNGGTQPGTTGTGSTGPSTASPQPDAERINAAITARFGNPTQLTPEGISASIERMSNTDLRSFLGELGIPAAALQRADDATLRQLVEDTLNEIAAQTAGAATGTGQ